MRLRECPCGATENSNMIEWRVDYSIVRGYAKGNAGRVLVVGDDEGQARAAAFEAASDVHDEIEIVRVMPFLNAA